MIDHLVYAAPDLTEGVEAIERLTGVRPAAGGKHVGMGTHNALLGLGERVYLEVIAPDPDQPTPTRPLPFGLASLTRPRLAAWAASTTDLDGLVESARTAGYDPGVAVSMLRRRPDGALLEWRLALREQPFGDGLVPFVIDWGDSPHPADSAPQGCRLVSLRGEHPDPGPVRSALEALACDFPMTLGLTPALVAVLETPQGTVELH